MGDGGNDALPLVTSTEFHGMFLAVMKVLINDKAWFMPTLTVYLLLLKQVVGRVLVLRLLLFKSTMPIVLLLIVTNLTMTDVKQRC